MTDKTKQDKYVQTQDKERVMGVANYMDKFVKDIDEMQKLADRRAKVKGIVDDMEFMKTRTSAIRQNMKVASFGKAKTKKRQVVTTEQKAKGVNITPATGKRIVFDFLRNVEAGHEPAVNI